MTSAAPPRTNLPADSIKGVIHRSTGQGPERLGRARIVLHRIGSATQGPIDSVITTDDGRFRFRFARDTSALYLVSARFAGIEYFSDAITRDASDVELVVFDTATA